MYVGIPCLDYLTLTSFSFYDYHKLTNLIDSLGGESDVASRRGYQGFLGDNFFYGDGMQSSGRHYLTRVWGDMCLLYGLGVRSLDLSFHLVECRRIDVQLTIPLDGRYSAFALEKYLQSGDNWKGRKRKVKIVGSSSDRYNTLYIGARKESDRFIRLYVKDGGRNGDFLRFELEYKRKAASVVFQRYLDYGSADLATLMVSELERLPSHWIFDKFLSVLSGVPSNKLYIPPRVRTDWDSLYWIRDRVMPTVERLLASHETGGAMSRILRVALDEFTAA
jgi:hypothetical protein